jgi:serine/threonine protein kinase/ligand-binding sensor domain-containing protein
MRSRHLVALLAAALVAAPALALAGDVAARGIPSMRVFGSPEGLPQSTAQAIAFEPSGRLWIGTQAGPAFSDGKLFTPLTLPHAERSTNVLSITVARDGAAWFGTNGGGAARYARERFTSFTEADGLPSDFVLALAETHEGEASVIWAGTSRGLARRRHDEARFLPVDLGAALAGAPVYALREGLLPSGEPTLWVGTDGGLAHCESLRCEPAATDTALAHAHVRALLPTLDEAGAPALWVGTTSGLARYDGLGASTISAASSPLVDGDVRALAETTSGSGARSLWVGTMAGGLARLRDGMWTTLTLDNSGLPSNQIWALAASGGALGSRMLWVGTGSGLARLRHDGFTSFNAKSAGFPGADGTGIAERLTPGGAPEPWVAVSDKVMRFSGGAWSAFDPKALGLSTSWIYALLRPRRSPSSIWIGTEGGGVGRWDGATMTMTTFTSRSSPLPVDSVYSLAESLDGRAVWFGTYRGAARLEGETWSVVTLDPRPDGKNRIRAILETPRGGGEADTWFGTDAGLFRLSNGALQAFTATNSPLQNDQIYALAELRDARGLRSLWIGTQGGGVARYDLDAEAWRTPLTSTSSPALPDDTIYGVVADARGRVYVSTNRGVARLTPRAPTPDDPSDLDVYTFTTEDGLPSDECNWNSNLIDSAGHVWAGTTGGVAVLAPEEEVDDRVERPLLLAPPRVAGRAAPLAPGEELSHQQNTISFDYLLRSFFRERDTRYKTQLLGFDPSPSGWSAETSARYTNLAEGAYTFKVWARSCTGAISGPASASFSVRPAPFRTLWAYLAYALAAVGLGYVSVRARIRALALQNRELEARVAARTSELDRKKDELAENLSKLEAARGEAERKNAELDRKVTELARKNAELEASHQRADRIFSALADVLPGTVLDGKYRLEHKIGAGGFGVVFQAQHLSLGRPVAVKVFRPSQGNDSALALERFRDEGASASRVVHPNAVQVFDAGISREGIAYIVMELLEGRSLADELAARGTLSLPRASRVLAEVCDVLAAAHQGGLVHRDIKPENVFLHRTPEGETVKVVDFGIAKQLGEDLAPRRLTATGGILGTPSYMAPERLKGELYDARSDIYSVGVTAYEMVSGALPYPVGSAFDQMMRVLTQAPRPLGEVAPWLPAEAAAVVMRCLEKDPVDRPSLADLARGFGEAVGAASPEEGRYSTSPPPPRKVDPMAVTLEITPGSGSFQGSTATHDRGS